MTTAQDDSSGIKSKSYTFFRLGLADVFNIFHFIPRKILHLYELPSTEL